MRAIGRNIWKGFACFSSSARLGTLAYCQESTAIPRVTSAENQRGGREGNGMQLLNGTVNGQGVNSDHEKTR